MSSANGAVTALEIVGSASAVTLEKEQIRTVLGAEKIKSLIFSLSGTPSSGSGAADALYAEGAAGSSAANRHGLSETAWVISAASGDKADISARKSSELWLLGASGLPAAASAPGIDKVADGMVNFTGKGYGHGVGMPQDSAIAMAEQGLGFEQILNEYYTGIRIEK